MLLVFLCELITFLVIKQTGPYTGYQDSFYGLAFYTPLACALIWADVTLYTGFFIFLTEYHSAIGKFLDRFLFLRRRVQPMCLRVVAYSYVVGLNSSVALFLFLVLYSVE